jgi:hypothetical protein
MHGDEQVALLQFAFVPLGLIFGHTHPNQGSRKTPERRPSCGPAECRHDRSRRDEGAQAWNGEGPNPDQPTQGTP